MRDEFQGWQPGAPAKLREVLRMPDELGSPELARQPVDLTRQRWGRSRKESAFRIDRVRYQTMPGVRATAYLFSLAKERRTRGGAMNETAPAIDPRHAMLLVMDYQPAILNNLPGAEGRMYVLEDGSLDSMGAR
jgi:hypothetical protein